MTVLRAKYLVVDFGGLHSCTRQGKEFLSYKQFNRLKSVSPFIRLLD